MAMHRTALPFDLKISAEKTSLSIVFKKGVPFERCLMPGDILGRLEKLGVTKGINKEKIHKTIAAYNENGFAESAVIAESNPPVHGRDARLEYFIKPIEITAELQADCLADINSRDIICVVKKGQPLFKYLFPTKAKDGIDVFGKVIPAKKGKPLPFPEIPNTQISEEDQSVVLAAKDGNVLFTEKDFAILGFQEVDAATLQPQKEYAFESSVRIKGNIEPDVKLAVKGNLEVTGTVYDSQIQADGDIVIKNGFCGRGQGKVRATGAVICLYIHNQSIEANRDIYIVNEAFNSNLATYGRVHCTGNKLGFVGGVCCATRGFEARSLGNDMEAATRVELGIDFRITKNLITLMKKHHQLQMDNARLKSRLKKVEAMRKAKTGDFDKLIQEMESLMEKEMETDLAIQELSARITKMKKNERRCERPEANIRGAINRGTVITINNSSRKIDRLIQRKKFFADGKVIQDMPL